MKQIERQLLINLLSKNNSEFIAEQIVHVLFMLYGKEIDIENNKEN